MILVRALEDLVSGLLGEMVGLQLVTKLVKRGGIAGVE
jgi:hypothetical protein